MLVKCYHNKTLVVVNVTEFIASYFEGNFIYIYIYIYIYIRGVTGGTDQTSGGCSLCYTISI